MILLRHRKLWNDRVVEIDAKPVSGEKRYAALGRIGGIVHLIVITYRGEIRRIISARHATKNESAIYESINP